MRRAIQGAAFALVLLGGCAGLTLLALSRGEVRLRGERLHALRPDRRSTATEGPPVQRHSRWESAAASHLLRGSGVRRRLPDPLRAGREGVASPGSPAAAHASRPSTTSTSRCRSGSESPGSGSAALAGLDLRAQRLGRLLQGSFTWS